MGNVMKQDVFAQLSLNNHKGLEIARVNMLKQQIRTWDVLDDKILSLFYSTPREDFVPQKYQPLAFADFCIPLNRDKKMMLPREEAKILQEFAFNGEEKVLVLGGDSGFLVALLAKLSKEVYYFESNLTDLEQIRTKLAPYKFSNIVTLIGNLNEGWQDLCPFDVILLTGSMPSIPEFLKNSLSMNGRLFVVIGQLPIMEATLIIRSSNLTWAEKKLFETERPRLQDSIEEEQFLF